MTEPSHKLSVKLVQLSQMIYEDDLDDEFTIIKKSRPKCGFVQKGSNVFVVFRGTKTKNNVSADTKISSLYGITNNSDEKIQAGFLIFYLRCRFELLSALQKLKKVKNVYFTGHSLGGAIATIAAFDFKRNNPSKTVHCYTFGAPTAGNKTFANQFDKIIDESWRFVHPDDIVPKSKRSFLAKKLLKTTEHTKTKVVLLPSKRNGLFDSHKIENYEHYIANKAYKVSK